MSFLVGVADVAAVYAGATPAQAVYLGGTQIWASAPPFNPADIAGLGLWLDAQQITGLADGEPVTTWPDASGQAHTATFDARISGERRCMRRRG